MTGGFDVQPDDLRRGAVDLRSDATRMDAGRVAASTAAQRAAGVAGVGPLSGVLGEFATQVDTATAAVRRSIEDAASALDASATTYLESDRAAADGMPEIVVPGLDGPR